MKPTLATKIAIVEKLNELLEEQKVLLETTIAEAKKARDQETKSSVGDKFETGRARLQAEIDRYNIQLNKTKQLKNELLQIDLTKTHTKVTAGSLLVTSKGNYFISIGFGKIEVYENNYYVISLVSPVGKLFNHKTVGSVVQHLQHTYEILALI